MGLLLGGSGNDDLYGDKETTSVKVPAGTLVQRS
jgi:hypothetical protein